MVIDIYVNDKIDILIALLNSNVFHTKEPEKVSIMLNDKTKICEYNGCKNRVELYSGGVTSSIYRFLDKHIVLKKIKHNWNRYNVFEREVHILKLLNKNNISWCPKLFYYDNKKLIMIMEYVGVVLKDNNKPNDYKEQAQKILNDLKRLNVQHQDIKKNKEVLVNENGKIFICDFGWGTINNCHSCGINLWKGKKPCGYINDNTLLSMF